MAWEENSRICINMQRIAILSRTGVKYWFHRHFDVTKVGFSIRTEKKGYCLCAIFNIIMTLFHYIFTTLSIIAEKRTDYSKKQIRALRFSKS